MTERNYMQNWATQELNKMNTEAQPLTDFRRAKKEALIQAIDDGDELEYELATAIAAQPNDVAYIYKLLAAMRERDLAGAGYTLREEVEG